MANLNYDEGIHYLVTRPVEPIIDDGVGNYNISPIGFPLANVSGDFNENPTRITPEFVVGYNNVVDASSRLVVNYTENAKSIDDLSGIKTFTNDVDTITLVGSTATVTTIHEHGYVDGATVTIKGADQIEYDGDVTITVVDSEPYTFTYTVVGTPDTPATGIITSSYESSDNELIVLTAQENSDDNGYYIVTENQWRILYVESSKNKDINVNANINIDVSVGSTPIISYTIDTIKAITLGTGRVLAEVTTNDYNGFADGNLITITGSIYSQYNVVDAPISIHFVGDDNYPDDKRKYQVFRYEIVSDPGVDDTGAATAAYTVGDGDLVNLVAQVDDILTENIDERIPALYIARKESAWEFYGFIYQWDGTENDNVAGEYSDELDANGEPINHYRKGYSLEETSDFLKEKLDVQIEFGKYKGSNHNMSDHGAFVRWMMSGRRVNIGGAGVNHNVFIDGFGLGTPNAVKRGLLTTGVVDPSDPNAVASKQAELSMRKKPTLWGLTNHHSHALDGFFNKSPFVKDYPKIYNSAYDDLDPYGFLTGGHLPSDVDVERWRMTITNGTSVSTDTEVRPIMIDTLWYQRDNSYHNNITLDATDPNMFGRHSMSIVNNFDTEDKIVLTEQELTDASINPTTDVITVPDGTAWAVDDYVQFVPATGATLPTGLSEYTTYTVATVNSNDLKLTGVDMTDSGSGTFTIERHVFDPYNNNEVIDALNDIANIEFNGNVIVLKHIVDNVTNYYIKPREKSSLNLLIPKDSGWSEDTLTYSATNDNEINIYLESNETNFVTFKHPTLSTTDLMDELNQHNDMIPVPFDPSTTDIDSLTSIFVDNTLVDYTEAVNQSNKIRSKKTFIHLPTPMDLPDGTPFEIDVSLPIIPETNSFPFNTVGSLSGYKNYVTQPRVYVMSGHQKFVCDNHVVDSLTHMSGDATMILSDDHGIYTSTFTDTEVEPTMNYIAVSNWKDISVGDIVRFKTDGVLPTATPAIITATDYVVTVVEFGKIKIATTTGTPIDITVASGGGTHSILIQSPIRFNLRESSNSYYNDEFDGYVYDFDTIKFKVDTDAVSPAPGPIIIDRVITVTGSNGTKGLTERNNSSVFSPMPEVEFGEDGNLYHQGFDTDNLVGNGLTGDDRDIRTLIATVYPTTTSTFAWRIDNSPRIRMLQWSLMNVSALGGTAETGSFSNVVYKRNQVIFNEFPLVFKDGSNGKFSVYDNPLSYTDTTNPTFTQQQINGLVRIRYPESLVPQSTNDLLSEEDTDTVGSFLYQAAEAYSDLIRDFQAGRVLVDSNNENLDEYKASLPINHDGVNEIPISFFDNDTTTKFIDYTSVDSMSPDAEYDAYQRWYTKNIYAPEYIVSAQGSTKLLTFDVYKNVDQTLKDYINTFYTDSSDRVSSSNNRYIADILNPSIDPEFEFSVGSQHKFIDYVSNNSTGTSGEATTLDDIRRRFWDSSYVIPDVTERKLQNAYHITKDGASIKDSAKFHGAGWIPFAKIFSTDGVAPSENVIEDIIDYTTITGIGGSYPELNTTLEYPELNTTLDNAIASNLIAERYKNLGYIESFVSVNTVDSTDSDKEEFLRNYVTGYANRLPFRFYNGFKIAVTGNVDSVAYGTDITNILVDTESDVKRIYTYSIDQYLTSYMSIPNIDVGQYLNDNFLLHESTDDNIYAHDLNPAWWYFEEGNLVNDSANSKINDMITVSGMNHIADREFYTSKMKYNYTRVKMSFVFSQKLGRWMTLDYRQAPTSYLTPTFGATALRQREKSIAVPGGSNMDITSYVNAFQPDINNSTSMRILNNKHLVKIGGDVEYSVGDIISIFIKDSSNSTVNTISTITSYDVDEITTYNYYLANPLPNVFDLFTDIQVSYSINTLATGEYPINLLTGASITDFLWKNPVCFNSNNIYNELRTTPYWKMQPMILNPTCYPFLSKEFPYAVDGSLKDVLNYTYDSSGAGDYRFTRLIEPNLAGPDGINFVVPTNVYGDDPNSNPNSEISGDSLFLYQPHMWKVFWHMRPAVCAMMGTDIPSPTSRTGGKMGDAFLSNMFCYPDARNPQYYVPWHKDMNVDWLNSGWLIIDAEIDDEDTNSERDLYHEIDAEIINGDDERNDFWEITADTPQRP